MRDPFIRRSAEIDASQEGCGLRERGIRAAFKITVKHQNQYLSEFQFRSNKPQGARHIRASDRGAGEGQFAVQDAD